MMIELQHIHFMPKELEPSVLYVSKEFGTAAHLCACDCGNKVRTPLGPTEWTLKETRYGPTLYPSIGNWQLACQSHYWIYRGKIIWAETWTQEQIVDGRRCEEAQRDAYFRNLYRDNSTLTQEFILWLKGFFAKSKN